MKIKIILILVLLIKCNLSFGQMNIDITLDCDTTYDDKGNRSASCFWISLQISGFNYSDSIKELSPEVTVRYNIDSLCKKTILKTEIKNKKKYSKSQLIYIEKYYERIVENATLTFKTSSKKTIDCKIVALKRLGPMIVNFRWF
jgi:hypothetical protein